MAVQVKESKSKLRTIVTNTNTDGTMKRKSITISNINGEANNDNLFSLARGIANLIDGNFAGAIKAKDDYLEEII